MGVYKQRNSDKWWYKFAWRGRTIRESTKQTNKRVAKQMESARKTQLAKGEVGIEDRKPSPTLKSFLETLLALLRDHEKGRAEYRELLSFSNSKVSHRLCSLC